MAKKRKPENQNGSGVEKTAEPEQLRKQMLNFNLRLVLSDVDDLLQVMQRMNKHLKELTNEINDK